MTTDTSIPTVPPTTTTTTMDEANPITPLKRKQTPTDSTPLPVPTTLDESTTSTPPSVIAAAAVDEDETRAKRVKTDDVAAAAVVVDDKKDENKREVQLVEDVEMEGENVEDKVDNEAEDEVDDEEDDDDVSIYPDTQEFYAWLSMDGPSGAFLACHGLETMEAAIAAIKEVKEDEKEKEKVKEIVDDAIDNAYCITVVDAAAPAVEGEGEEKKKEEEGEKKDTPAAAPTTSALWSLAETAGKDKLWMKIKVAREKPAADEKMEAVDIAVADLDPREGLIIPKISGWKYLVGVESVSKEVSDAIKGMMEANL